MADNDETYDKPVAYTPEGQPLYAHPSAKTRGIDYEKPVELNSHVTEGAVHVSGENFDPRIRRQYSNEPEVFHTTRPIEPRKMVVSEENQRRHEESKRLYPNLNLSEGEYVILHVRRHIIGLLMPVFVTGFITLLLICVLVLYPSFVDIAHVTIGYETIAPMIVLMIVLAVLIGYAAVWIYAQNRFYMTNESVIQEIQKGLFSRHEQSVSLGSIEDASFVQNGLLPTLLNYGTMRLSTEGEETTYMFQYVSDPHRQTSIVTNGVEAFKNGRPVVDD